MSVESLRFNQDATLFAAVTNDNDINIYNCDPFSHCFHSDDQNQAKTVVENRSDSFKYGSDKNVLVELLFSTNLIAVVDKTQNNVAAKKVKIVNTKRKSTICELTFPATVENLLMNRKRLCILLNDETIWIYDVSCMKHLKTIDIKNYKDKENGTEDIPLTNISGILEIKKHFKPQMSLSQDDKGVLAFSTYSANKNSPESLKTLNRVVAFDLTNFRLIREFDEVHKGNIVCLTISSDGGKIATCSEKGTVIRVFDVNSEIKGEPLFSFRRGNRPCHMFQLTFNFEANLIACAGNTDTIHIFKLDNSGVVPINEDSSLLTSPVASTVKSDGNSKHLKKIIAKTIKTTLPGQAITRDFAHIPLSNSKVNHIVGFSREFPNELYVIGLDGLFSSYSMPSSSGRCVLSKRLSYI